jgi:sulfate adenylyltransferase subunit 2
MILVPPHGLPSGGLIPLIDFMGNIDKGDMYMTENRLTHLKQLEAESIHIIREVAAEFENPVMLYSIGKDSAVMLHLALKAFYPAKLPFPLLHVDTGWKFKDMIAFRDNMAKTWL